MVGFACVYLFLVVFFPPKCNNLQNLINTLPEVFLFNLVKFSVANDEMSNFAKCENCIL